MTNGLIADDHALLRAGLKQALAENFRIRTIGEAATAAQTLDMLRQGAWDLLILDINLPDRSGIDVLKDAKSAFPGLRILVVSGFPERQYAVNVLRAGASGYLTKDSAADDFVKAVKTIMQSQRYIGARLSELLIADIDATDAPLHTQLSEREFQTFIKLAAGRSASAIAGELGLSVKTVSTYRSRVLEKMDFRSNADITTYALRNGLLQSVAGPLRPTGPVPESLAPMGARETYQ